MQLPSLAFFASWLALDQLSILTSATPAPSAATAAAAADVHCPAISPRPLTVRELGAAFPPRAVRNAAAVETIKRSLTLYAFAVDGRDWDALGAVFATDATADYGAPIGRLTGLEAIKRALPPYVTVYASTQHLLGTQLVDVCGRDVAVSVTYFKAAHFSNGMTSSTAPVDDGQVLYAFGQYQDRWRKERGGTWKIEHRNLVHMGPFISDIA